MSIDFVARDRASRDHAPLYFLALIAALAWPALRELAEVWRFQPAYSHAPFVPFTAAFFAWLRRDAWLARVPAKEGYPVLLGGVVLLAMAELGRSPAIGAIALWVALAGLVMAAGGRQLLAAWVLPLGILLFAVPLPESWVTGATLPLQSFATSSAGAILDAAGVPYYRDGNLITLAGGMLLQVADACSGVRSAGTLVFLAVVVAAGRDREVIRRGAVLVAAALVVAVLANVARLTGTAWLAAAGYAAWAEGFYHSLSGWVFFGLALAALLLADRVLLQCAGHGEETSPRRR